MYQNKAFIIGNLTRKPELNHTASGLAVTNLSVAINKTYTKDGEKVENVTFLSIGVFGRMAETCAEYLEKGQKVQVEGEVTNKAIEKEDGSKEYRTGIIAHSVQFGPRSSKSTTDEPNEAVGGKNEPKKGVNKPVTPKPLAPDHGFDYPNPEDAGIDPDEIPF